MYIIYSSILLYIYNIYSCPKIIKYRMFKNEKEQNTSTPFKVKALRHLLL